MTPATPETPATPDVAAGAGLPLHALPGFQIRRLQQIAVAIFLQETDGLDITPVQFAALQATANEPGIDQRRLAARIGFDTSTLGGVIDRLQARGLLRRGTTAQDRRVRRLTLTADGQARLAAVRPAMQRAQTRILAPLPPEQQAQFMAMLDTLVEANNELSRAPSAARPAG